MLCNRRFPRYLRWWLVLSLLFAPLLSAHAGMTAAAPDAAKHCVAGAMDSHAGHAKHVEHGKMSAATDCAQHSSCNGPCCTDCAHCAGVSPPADVHALIHQAVRTPHLPELNPVLLVAFRERPPRQLLA